MFATALIVFREILEASLVVGIVAAATRGVFGRGRWIGAGVGAGLLGALFVAGGADVLARAASGLGQEIFNASVLIGAVALLGWHNVWMRKHGRELTLHLRQVGGEVAQGSRPLYGIAVVVALAVLREGAEVVLFLYGIVAAGGTNLASMLSGGLLGLASGSLIGITLYLGLLRIPTHRFFAVTGWLIVLLAAGMAAQAAAYLIQADLLPPLAAPLWDSSAWLAEQSILGQILHGLVGYVARPSAMQVLVYLGTIVLISVCMRYASRGGGRLTTVTAVAAGAAVTLMVSAIPAPVQATHKVYSPHVERHALELETRGHIDNDDDPLSDDAQKVKFEVGYGFTDRWFSSLFFEYAQPPSGDFEHEATAWENIIQLTDQGARWLDLGLYAEYERAAHDLDSDKVEVKLLLEKEAGRLVHTANLGFSHEVGSGAAGGTDLDYAWRTKWRYTKRLEPALELYGDLGKLNNLHSPSRQAHSLGPVASGVFSFGEEGKLVYELGYLFGLTSATLDGILKWRLEYELEF